MGDRKSDGGKEVTILTGALSSLADALVSASGAEGRRGTTVALPLAALGAPIVAALVLLATPYDWLAPAVPLAAVALVVLFRHPWTGLALIIFTVPFDAFRGASGNLQYLTIGKFVGALLVVLAALDLALGRLPPRRLSANVWRWLLPFFVVNALAAALSTYPLTSLDMLRQIFTALMVVALCLIHMDGERRLALLADVIIGSVALSATLSVAGYVLKIPELAMGLDGTTSIERAVGGAKDPNVFSSLLVFAAPLMIARLVHARGGIRRALYGMAFVSDIAANVLTFSRGGALAILLTLALVGWHYRRLISVRRLGLALVGMMAVAGVALAIIPQGFWDRQASLSNPADESVERRTAYLKVAKDAFLASPIIGHGPDSFRELFAQSAYASAYLGGPTDTLFRYAHNTYVEVLVGSGFMGLSLFLALIAQTWRNFSRALRLLTAAGATELADMAACWRLSFGGLAAYLLILSQLPIKYLWVAPAVSAIFLRLAAARAPKT